jgi:hypothetical protein
MKASGIFMILIGAAMCLVGLIFGVMAVDEYGRYSQLVREGNPFATLVANSGTYLIGTAVLGVLGGVGLILAGAAQKQPANKGTGLAAPGWYPDPSRPGSTRYWNGSAWADSAG